MSYLNLSPLPSLPYLTFFPMMYLCMCYHRPYSPHVNPIEHSFTHVKAYIRRYRILGITNPLTSENENHEYRRQAPRGGLCGALDIAFAFHLVRNIFFCFLSFAFPYRLPFCLSLPPDLYLTSILLPHHCLSNVPISNCVMSS